MDSKRLIDASVAMIGLIIFMPLMVLIAGLIYVKLGAPVLFRQVRPGLGGRPFQMLKFRTLTEDIGANGELLPDGLRITPFGSWLRSTSLDELPELWNVLKGEMSLVGPRPLLIEYLPLYNALQLRRHEVKPGLTGWAQINGRNAQTWDERFRMDVWYVDNRSLQLDLLILLKTLQKVLTREGIAADGEVSMQKFKGNNL